MGCGRYRDGGLFDVRDIARRGGGGGGEVFGNCDNRPKGAVLEPGGGLFGVGYFPLIAGGTILGRFAGFDQTTRELAPQRHKLPLSFHRFVIIDDRSGDLVEAILRLGEDADQDPGRNQRDQDRDDHPQNWARLFRSKRSKTVHFLTTLQKRSSPARAAEAAALWGRELDLGRRRAPRAVPARWPGRGR